MKKLLMKLVFVGMFIFGFAFASNAVEITCISVTIDCGDGTGTVGLACGATAMEIAEEADALAEAFCGD